MTSLIHDRARLYGLQKQLAAEAGMSEVALSRLLNEDVPRLVKLLDLIGLEIVEKGHTQDLRRVLKAVL